MGPLGSSLQGQYEKTTENKKHMTLLVKKLPLTLVQKRTCGLRKEITRKFYYNPVNLLIEEYLEYMIEFQDRKEKLESWT